MGYRKIHNLYKTVDILLFKECYALEKIHGTSAHIAYEHGEIRFFSGGAPHEQFVGLFNVPHLLDAFNALGQDKVVVYGEAYGGKMQGMSGTYGKELKFIAFEVKIHDTWLCVPNACNIVEKLGLEFVFYNKGPATTEWLDSQRDRSSEQAKRNGIVENKHSEGIVARPLMEMVKSNGERIIIKHKRAEFRETKTQRVVDPSKLKILDDAREVADEWVTDMRLEHVLDKMPEKGEMQHIPLVIKSMLADIKIESKDEVIWSKDVERAIGKATVDMYKKLISKIPV